MLPFGRPAPGRAPPLAIEFIEKPSGYCVDCTTAGADMDDEDKKRIHSLLVKAQGGPDKLEIFDVELTDKDVVSSFSSRVQDETGKFVNRVFISHKLGDEMRLVALEKELHHLLAVAEDKFEPGDVSRLFGWV